MQYRNGASKKNFGYKRNMLRNGRSSNYFKRYFDGIRTPKRSSWISDECSEEKQTKYFNFI